MTLSSRESHNAGFPQPANDLIDWVRRIYQASVASKDLREDQRYQRENLTQPFRELMVSDFVLSEALKSLEGTDFSRVRRVFDIYLRKLERALWQYQKNEYADGKTPPNLYFTSFLAERIAEFQINPITGPTFQVREFRDRINTLISERERQHAYDLAHELRSALPRNPNSIIEIADIGAKDGISGETLETEMRGKVRVDSFDKNPIQGRGSREVKELDILDTENIQMILSLREGKRYDSVILSNILHKLDLDDQRRALENARALSDTIILVVPNMDDPVTRELSAFDGSAFKQNGSIRTDEMLRTQVIIPAGFEVEKLYDLNGRVSLLDGFYHRMYKLRKKKESHS